MHEFPSKVQHVIELVDIGAQRAVTGAGEHVNFHR